MDDDRLLEERKKTSSKRQESLIHNDAEHQLAATTSTEAATQGATAAAAATTASHFNSKDEFVSGYLAACTSIALLFPLNKLIFRQMLDGLSFRHALAQLHAEGVSHAYRGILPPLLQKSTSYSVMFGSQHEYYTRLMQSRLGRSTMSFNTRKHVFTGLAGGLAGLTEATLTPFERVQALLQMQQFHAKYKNTWSVFESVVSHYGLRELFRGYGAICLRNSVSNVLFFTSRNDIKQLMPKTKSRLRNAGYDFLTGGLLGAFLSTITYPLNVLKSHMQARLGGKHLSLVETFWMVFDARDRRWSMLYKGVSANFMRAVLAWGITNSSYEGIIMAIKRHKRHLDHINDDDDDNDGGADDGYDHDANRFKPTLFGDSQHSR